MEEFREWLKGVIKETKEPAIEDAENECYDFFLMRSAEWCGYERCLEKFDELFGLSEG